MAAAGGSNRPTRFLRHVFFRLLSGQATVMEIREEELQLRRDELYTEREKLKLQEHRLDLERAGFEIQRQERERRLRSEHQERTLFIETLKKVISTGFASS